ncbi:glycosyltransferase family 2 protein [Streptomyces sp. NPDC013178]|uniref:glycosyltransferase family 2 protein n=1 Tax=unclassified Streptomyces TaxID=2593676 RepID=UPI0033E8BE6A
MKLVVLIPAHNEAARITGALRSLRGQSRPPDTVVVISDNSVDDTVLVARSQSVQVMESVDNHEKKAGALNQALERLLPSLDDRDAVVVMDADSVIAEDFLAVAEQQLNTDSTLGAVGGVFYGDPGGGLLGQLQRNEYVRYSRDIARRRGRVMVLTGTASAIRVRALRDVAAARGTRLPGTPGKVYDTLALTEDNELTLALKTLGWGLTSPPSCHVTTEIMHSWRDLWRQRMRWQRGALDNLRHYGLTRVTLHYWAQQAGMAVGVIAMALYLLLTAITAVVGGWQPHPLWTAVGVVFVLERTITVWCGGWRARALALPLAVELAYDLFIQAVFVRCVADFLTRRPTRWHHPGEPRAGLTTG